ncbi:MAG: hypothetical protein Q9157_002571 [Trypethelium eluteriae]
MMPPTSGLQPDLLDALKSQRAKIQEIKKILGVAGLSITVIDYGETIFPENLGYSNLAKKDPVTLDTIFHIASLTKSFTGACINRLKGQGWLTYDDLIQKHLPTAKSRDPVVAATATIADLLGHRTGLQKADSIWLGSGGELLFSKDQTATVFSHLRPRASLRSQFQYNNICYAVLEEIITKYYKALMRSWRSRTHAEKDARGTETPGSVFDDVLWPLAPLQIMETPVIREKSYATGWARSQLPTTVGDIGVNPGLMEKMPLLADGIGSRLALWHQDRSAVLVLTNTMAFNDAADWIGQLLVETLLDSPVHNDYVHLASVSSDRALKRYEELSQEVEKGRELEKPNRPLSDYVGSYVGFGGVFRIEVVETENGLEMLFQGRESQAYRLQYHSDNTFTWLTSWNEQIKRARFIIFQPDFYSIRFKTGDDNGITTLKWVHDSAVPEGEDFIREEIATGLYSTKMRL